MERMSLSERDLHTMLRIVSNPDEGDEGEPFPWSVLADLAKVIGVDSLVFQQLDSKRRQAPIVQGFPAKGPSVDEDALDAVFWSQYWSCPACSYPDWTGDVVSVMRLSDFYTRRQLHNSGIWTEYMRLTGDEHEMMLCLPSQPGNTLRLVLWRGPGSDFSERDRTLLTLLRPHLDARFRQWRQRQQVPMLTSRQWDLLRLVAAGHTNRQIARRLHITEGTVRTHLENIFERLQVTSRTAAVARAFLDGHTE
jgi:DNA-binding CsgD family transcriptional regulator